ncbi:MAG: hypothetical protein UX12_C0022G0001, partial [Candidatus Collierbacteria bacterium GW2011_GWC1_45_47]
TDANGADDIDRVYISFNNCTVTPGDAGWSNFEHNNANFFGSFYLNYASPVIAAARNNANAACTGTVASPTDPWSYSPLSNAPGNITLNTVGRTLSGNNFTNSWNITTSNLPLGTYNYYMMARDKEMLWHTHPAAYSWTKKNSVCVEGFSLTDPDYVSAWTSACGNQTRTCTQDCSFTNNCAGVPVAQCIECWTTARVSAFSTWSTCNAITHKRTQTRTCTEDCDNGTESGECETYFASNCPSGSSCVTTGSGLSWTQTVTQDCRGTVSVPSTMLRMPPLVLP